MLVAVLVRAAPRDSAEVCMRAKASAEANFNGSFTRVSFVFNSLLHMYFFI